MIGRLVRILENNVYMYYDEEKDKFFYEQM